MGLVWNPIGAIGVTSGILALVLAFVVWVHGGTRRAKLPVVLILLLDGVIAMSAVGAIYLTDDPRSVYAWQCLAGLAFAFFVPLYALLLSRLDTPFTRPLRLWPVRAALWASAAVFLVLFYARRELFIVGVRRAEYATWDAQMGSLALATMPVMLAILVLALVASIWAWRSARTPATRRQAGLYALAFGTRDVITALAWVLIVANEDHTWANTVSAMTGLTYVPILAYAILSGNILGIDLRIKWTIRRGTLVGAFAVVFIVVAEVAQNWLSDAYGYVAGGLAAAALIAAIRPLDRAAARVADVAMPKVQETPAYLAYRKLEVYRAALEGAFADGEVTQREREMLRRLRESLGLPEADAAALERDVASAQPA